MAERILALVTPQERSQRLLRRAWRSSQRLQAELDILWIRRPGQQLDEREVADLAALRRLAVVLGGHFLEEEADALDARFQVDRLILFRSLLGGGPARYEALHESPLVG